MVAETPHPVVIDMPEHNPGDMGGTMRLGKRQTIFKSNDSILRQIYGNAVRNNTSVIIDPLGLFHISSSSDHNSQLKFVLLHLILKSGDGQTFIRT